jgi:hypothetical protein
MNKTQLKAQFKATFKQTPIYQQNKKARLLAIQLNGFNHTAFLDYGNVNDPITILRFSHYTNMLDENTPIEIETATMLFSSFYHMQYKHDPIGIIYILPNQR